MVNGRQLKPVFYMSLAGIALVTHWALNTSFPGASGLISYAFFLLSSLLAFAVCSWRAWNSIAAARRNWILLSVGLLLWLTGCLLAARAEFIVHASPTRGALDDFFYFFYGVPILLSLVSSEESPLMSLFFWLDAIQAAVAGCLAYIAIFEVLPFSGQPLKPLSVDKLIWIYDCENVILATFAAARLAITPKDAPERRFFSILNTFLWAYLVSAAIYNHILSIAVNAGNLDVLVDAPFLILACAATLLPGPQSGTRRTRQLKPLALFIDSARPLAFGFAILALSAEIARQHFDVGMAAAFGAFGLYGFRSAALQSRFLRSQAALEKAMRKLNELALQDALTRVANRRCFDQRFTQEWNRCQRSQLPISLLLIDIDHFKQLNDTHGHQVGDECLVQVAQILRRAVKRPGDLLARYGGEEFVVLLPETDSAGAWNVALHMRALVSGVEEGVRLRLPLTVSIGVATRQPPEPGTAMSLLETADRAMYLAKQNGRDRIEVLPIFALSEDDSSE